MTPRLVDIPVLETERLRLRAPVASDFEPYRTYRMSPARTAGVGGPRSYLQCWDYFGELFGHWILRGYGRWIVADKETDAPFGLVGLFYPPDWPEPEIAWTVFAHGEGKGIAHEAAIATRAHAYDTLGWTRLVNLIMPGNTRSIALARRLGAVHESDYAHPDSGTLQIWRHLSPGECA